jgi:hypothetical protein
MFYGKHSQVEEFNLVISDKKHQIKITNKVSFFGLDISTRHLKLCQLKNPVMLFETRSNPNSIL